MIEIKNIFKNYKDKNILNNICTQIPKNKLTAFIGSNGAGKSTLLNIIANLIKPDLGSVLIDNYDIHSYHLNEFAKKISILKQSNHLNISLRVKELIEFGRYPYSFGKLDNNDNYYVDKSLNLMDLKHLQDKFLHELSGGERQRAFIAMTIAQDTDYILLDEPLNNLDMHHCAQIMHMLKNLVLNENKTVIVVLHDINFASFYADYILAIKDNQLYLNDEKSKMIQKDVLKDIFNMNLDILDCCDQKIIVHYNLL